MGTGFGVPAHWMTGVTVNHLPSEDCYFWGNVGAHGISTAIGVRTSDPGVR